MIGSGIVASRLSPSDVGLQSLVAAYAAKKAIVDESSARAAVTEVTEVTAE